jgi:hypothetical protein
LGRGRGKELVLVDRVEESPLARVNVGEDEENEDISASTDYNSSQEFSSFEAYMEFAEPGPEPMETTEEMASKAIEPMDRMALPTPPESRQHYSRT